MVEMYQAMLFQKYFSQIKKYVIISFVKKHL